MKKRVFVKSHKRLLFLLEWIDAEGSCQSAGHAAMLQFWATSLVINLLHIAAGENIDMDK